MSKAIPTTSPEVQKLREIYSSNPAFRAILNDFSGRSNSQRITTVDQVLNRLRIQDVQRSTVITLLRELEKLGHGKFVEGRKGHPSRFVWNSNLIEVGKASRGEEGVIAPLSQASEFQGNPIDIRLYTFPLRTDVDVIFQIPTDLRIEEAERLSAFIKTLAMPN